MKSGFFIMKALLYELGEEHQRQIVDYGIRLEEGEHFRAILGHVVACALENSDSVRADEVGTFLELHPESSTGVGSVTGDEPKSEETEDYFDITLTEARFARNALAKSARIEERLLGGQLQGTIDAEHAYMKGMHRSKWPQVREAYESRYVPISVQQPVGHPTPESPIAA